MQILIDYNLEGDAELLFATLLNDGWVELLGIEFVYFADTNIHPESEDTAVWRYAHENSGSDSPPMAYYHGVF